MNVNKVILVGRLGKDPEVKYTPTGLAIGNLSLATTETYKDKQGAEAKRTEWHKIVVFGKAAENCKKYLTKGRGVYVEGKLQTRSWEKDGIKHYSTEIIAQTVQFLFGAAPVDEALSQIQKPLVSPMPKHMMQEQQEFSVDDIPF